MGNHCSKTAQFTQSTHPQGLSVVQYGGSRREVFGHQIKGLKIFPLCTKKKKKKKKKKKLLAFIEFLSGNTCSLKKATYRI